MNMREVCLLIALIVKLPPRENHIRILLWSLKWSWWNAYKKKRGCFSFALSLKLPQRGNSRSRRSPVGSQVILVRGGHKGGCCGTWRRRRGDRWRRGGRPQPRSFYTAPIYILRFLLLPSAPRLHPPTLSPFFPSPSLFPVFLYCPAQLLFVV